jgi:phospholipid/cholesterol/gamma-HCH transport system substrate-binding protein
LENKAHALAAGLFVLLVTALVAGLGWWLSREDVLSRNFEISTRESVSGLQPQAAVRYRGVPVGKVINIGFDKERPGNVLIRFAVDNEVPITRGTFGSLGFQGVTGLAFLSLDDDGKSMEALSAANGQTPLIPLRPSLLTTIADQGTVILTELGETTRRLKKLLDEENQKTLFSSVKDLGVAAQSITKLSGEFGTVLDAQFGPQRTNIPQLVKETTQTMISSRQTLKDMEKAAQDVSKASTSFDATSLAFGKTAEQLSTPGGLLDRLGQASEALTFTTITLQQQTLPQLQRATSDAAKAFRTTDQTLQGVNQNPQQFIYGTAPVVPGPGEAGFSVPVEKK